MFFDRHSHIHHHYAPVPSGPRRDVPGWLAVVLAVVAFLGPGPNLGPWRERASSSPPAQTVVTTKTTRVVRDGRHVMVTVRTTTETRPSG